MNRNCDDIEFPADGLCSEGWEYSSPEKWEEDEEYQGCFLKGENEEVCLKELKRSTFNSLGRLMTEAGVREDDEDVVNIKS